MQLEVLHTWHITFQSDVVSYDASWTRLPDQLRLSGFTVNPMPSTTYTGFTVSHRHPGAVTLFTLQHPRLLRYVTISESP